MTMQSEWAYIKNREDWDHYCAKIDNHGRPFDIRIKEHIPPYFYFHDPEPASYPCLCQSEFVDDPNGPYCMYYSYVYLEDVAYLLHASLDDLVAERDAYRKLAIDLMILLGEVEKEEAERLVDTRIHSGRE